MSFTRDVAVSRDITPGHAAFWQAFVEVLRATAARPESTRSTIRVSTRSTTDRITILVEDDGPADDLASAREACEAAGGVVAMESREGQGSRIRFAFPKQNTAHESPPAVVLRAGTSAA